MKKVLLGLAVLATLSTATVCGAEIKGAPYVGAQIGAGSMDIPGNSMGFAYRISGGYDFAVNQTLHIAPEIGYNGYPDYSPSSDGGLLTYKGYNFDFLANVRYYVAKNISLIGKAGFAYATMSASALGLTVSDSKILPQLGLGAAYDLNKNVAFNVTYNHAFGDDMSSTTSTNPVASVNTVLAGVTYSFN